MYRESCRNEIQVINSNKSHVNESLSRAAFKNLESSWKLQFSTSSFVACCCHNSRSWDVKEASLASHIACNPPINFAWARFVGKHGIHTLHFSLLLHYSSKLHVFTCFACLYRELFISLSPLRARRRFILIYIQSTQCSSQKCQLAIWQWMKASLDDSFFSFFLSVETFLLRASRLLSNWILCCSCSAIIKWHLIGNLCWLSSCCFELVNISNARDKNNSNKKKVYKCGLNSPNDIFSFAARDHKISGTGSPPTRHWKITEPPAIAVWLLGPRIKNGFTVADDTEQSRRIFFRCYKRWNEKKKMKWN